jgi:ACR3 family arsenite efflux pump ArsB
MIALAVVLSIIFVLFLSRGASAVDAITDTIIVLVCSLVALYTICELANIFFDRFQ